MTIRLALAFLVACAVTRAPAPGASASSVVAIVAPAGAPAPVVHGVDRLRAALQARGLRVIEGTADTRADFYVTLFVEPTGCDPEALSIARSTHLGRPALDLRGGGERGLMYAALDAADRIEWSVNPRDPFARVRAVTETPYLKERGISIYTMHRATFERRLFDEAYWRKYFDLLAASRINTFMVVFGYENGGFMAPLYPYFFDVPAFPDVRFVGLSAAEQRRNTAAFKTMIRLAHERGISVSAGIWDHIYRAGVQTGGIQEAAKGDAPTPGLVWGVTAENLAPYTKAALQRFLAVFPELDAIQFRMHEESGLAPSEIAGFWHEVFAEIKAVRPDLRIDLRAKGLPEAVIDDALRQGLHMRVSTKFWMEQMGLPFHPTHVNPPDQKNRRHGYADLLPYPQRYRVHWTLWSGGTTRLLQWGDPEYVRRFAAAARLYGGDSFDVNEMLATKMLGEPHDAKPIDVLSEPYRFYEFEFERYWHFYQLWGRLTYAPDTPDETWDREFARRFGAVSGPHLERALHLASGVLPRIVASSYRYAAFPTTRGWAEMQHQDALPVFARLEGSDTEQFMTPADDAKSLIAGTPTSLRRPEETASWFAATADAIEKELALAPPQTGMLAAEYMTTLTDCRILAALARYYAARLPAAVAYDVYKQNGSLAAFDEAVAGERRAIDAWASIVAAAGDVYAPSLPFGARQYFPRHWREELARMRTDLDTLIASSPAAGPSTAVPRLPASGPIPTVTIDPAGGAIAGRALAVTVRVSPAAAVRTARLRYRHLTQYEDYASIDMTRAGDTFTARIPGGFITSSSDVMYFVEIVTGGGRGRNYPDLDRETPYVVVPVHR
jgi:hypothetical protein